MALLMTGDEFDNVVYAALQRMPQWVSDAFDNLELVILDRAGAELDPDGDGLLGLYVGTPLPERDANHAGELPDVIYLFRQPHFALNLDRVALEDEIVTTLVHEVAHYFGLDEARVHELGWG